MPSSSPSRADVMRARAFLMSLPHGLGAHEDTVDRDVMAVAKLIEDVRFGVVSALHPVK